VGILLYIYLSLILRILGDIAIQCDWRKWGGLLNEIVILLD